jgi:pre-rRNA-processing protein TSR3
MQSFPQTYILRHRRENLKKCSLTGLESRPDLCFFTYPTHTQLPDLSNHILLALDAPPLQLADCHRGLFILDATWRYAAKMQQFINQQALMEKRSLPSWIRSAYPRRQDDCPDPDKGLASIEAVYMAYLILGRETKGLLDRYYWKDLFLAKNHQVDTRTTLNQKVYHE